MAVIKTTDINILEGSSIVNTVCANVSYTLGANSENLVLTGGVSYNAKLSKKLATVYGNPTTWSKYLDYYQGDNSFNYQNDCGVVVCENMLIQMGLLDFKVNYKGRSKVIDSLETLLVEYAKSAGLIDTSFANNCYNGGMSISKDCPELLENCGLQASFGIKTLESIGEYIKENYTVAIAIDAYVIWGYTKEFSNINHAILVTGVAYDTNNDILGFYICDSGALSKSSAARYISYDLLSKAYSGYSIMSNEASKLYLDNINGSGNELDNTLVGNYGNNVLSGLAGNDSLSGGYGNDILWGGDGNDSLNGGLGTDKIIGGSGDDYYVVDNIKDVVIESRNYTTKKRVFVGYGTDTIILDSNYISSATNSETKIIKYNLAANVENLDLSILNSSRLIANGNGLDNTITGGNGDDTIYGYAGADSILGGKGDDYIDGGVGNEILIGGDGNDTYMINTFNDIVIDSGTEIEDTIILNRSFLENSLDLTTIDYTNIEIINASQVRKSLNIKASTSNTTILGSGGHDTILGNSKDITINGYYGNDSITGGAGNDTVYGGYGNDTLTGAGGINYLYGEQGNDWFILDGSETNTFISDLYGYDTVKLLSGYQKSFYNLDDNIENLDASLDVNTLMLSGNCSANIIKGSSGNNTLTGGNDKFADKLYGSDGDDTYFLYNNDRVYEYLNNGLDTVIFDSSYTGKSYSLNKTNIEVLDASNTSGNHVLSGSANSDTILGGSGKDYIKDGAGNDYLTGGAGNDTLIGGAGSDIYNFNAAFSDFDTIIETANKTDIDVISISNATIKNVLIYKNSYGVYIVDYGEKAETNTINLGKILNIEKIQLVDAKNVVTNYITSEQISGIVSAISSFNISDTNSNYATLSDITSQKTSDITLVNWS